MSKTENAIQTIEQQSKADLLSIHANMEMLIKSAEHITIAVDDKESYVQAVELKKTIKQTHVAIEKKRKELKAPIIEAGKTLDSFAKSIYVPLKEAEALLKEKMLPFEKIVEEQKIKEQQEKEQQQKQQEILQQKLDELNKTLFKINTCKNQTEINEIQNYLSEINLNDFGERSSEAGFIISNLKMTCNMVKKSLPEISSKIETKDETLDVFSDNPFPEIKPTNMGLDNVEYGSEGIERKQEVSPTFYVSEKKKMMRKNVVSSFVILQEELADVNEFRNLIETYSVSIGDLNELIETLEDVLKQKIYYQKNNK